MEFPSFLDISLPEAQWLIHPWFECVLLVEVSLDLLWGSVPPSPPSTRGHPSGKERSLPQQWKEKESLGIRGSFYEWTLQRLRAWRDSEDRACDVNNTYGCYIRLKWNTFYLMNFWSILKHLLSAGPGHTFRDAAFSRQTECSFPRKAAERFCRRLRSWKPFKLLSERSNNSSKRWMNLRLLLRVESVPKGHLKTFLSCTLCHLQIRMF